MRSRIDGVDSSPFPCRWRRARFTSDAFRPPRVRLGKFSLAPLVTRGSILSSVHQTALGSRGGRFLSFLHLSHWRVERISDPASRQGRGARGFPCFPRRPGSFAVLAHSGRELHATAPRVSCLALPCSKGSRPSWRNLVGLPFASLSGRFT